MSWLEESLRQIDEMGSGYGVTENGGKAYESSGSSGIDLFFQLVRGISPEEVVRYVESAWKESPEDTVKTLLHARDCRSGKGEKKAVYDALLWLRRHKPRTYVRNLEQFVDLGYGKDLLQLVGSLEEKDGFWLHKDGYVELVFMASVLKKDLATLLECMEKKSVEEFVAVKVEDVKNVRMSLMAKWAPSAGKSFDQGDLRCAKMLSKLMFPSTRDKRVKSQELYRKVLTRMRHCLRIVETKMCRSEWDTIAFGQVPSKAHRLYKKAFLKHVPEEYTGYLSKVAEGKEKINTAGLQPHELVYSYMSLGMTERNETLELQWQTMRGKIVGSLKNSLSVVDVSGSMAGEPMNVAIALGILTSELNKGLFQDHVITFSQKPEWVELKGSLCEKVKKMREAPWGMNTNLEAVFEMILRMAKAFGCSQEQMPKTLFIFSDMQFDHACENNKPIYEEMKERFREQGYTIPSIVFWNLRAVEKSFPVKQDENGTALVSGFSGELLNLFLEEKEISPRLIYRKAIDRYTCAIESSER